MEFGSLISLYPCLASKALLNNTRSLKPSPPTDFAFPSYINSTNEF